MPKAVSCCRDACASCIYTTTRFSNDVTKLLWSWPSFECVFTDMYLGGIQTVRWKTFTFTLLHLHIRSFFSVPLTPVHLWWVQRLQVWQSVEFTPTPLERILQGHLTLAVGFWGSPDEPSTLAFPTFIRRTRLSRDVLQACNWIFKFSKLPLMMTRLSAYRNFHGQPIRHSTRESFHHNSKTWRAYNRTLMSTDSYFKLLTETAVYLYSWVCTIVHNFHYLTIHSSMSNFLIAHQRTERGTRFLMHLLKDVYRICSTWPRHKTKLRVINVNLGAKKLSRTSSKTFIT